MNAFEKKFDLKIQEGFGLSETSPVASFGVLDKKELHRQAGDILERLGFPLRPTQTVMRSPMTDWTWPIPQSGLAGWRTNLPGIRSSVTVHPQG